MERNMAGNVTETHTRNVNERAVVSALALQKVRTLASKASYEAPSVHFVEIGGIKVRVPVVLAGNV